MKTPAPRRLRPLRLAVPVALLLALPGLALAQKPSLAMSPLQASGDVPPAIGEGDIYYREAYHPYLPYGVLGVVFLTMFAFIRLDWGFRILKSGRSQGSNRPSRPEQMV